MKTNTVVSAWNVHLIFFFDAPVRKIAAASNDFTPCIHLYHRFGAHTRGTFILKNKPVPFFQAKPAMPCFPLSSAFFSSWKIHSLSYPACRPLSTSPPPSAPYTTQEPPDKRHSPSSHQSAPGASAGTPPASLPIRN